MNRNERFDRDFALFKEAEHLAWGPAKHHNLIHSGCAWPIGYPFRWDSLLISPFALRIRRDGTIVPANTKYRKSVCFVPRVFLPEKNP